MDKASRTTSQIADRRKWLNFTLRPHQGPLPPRVALTNSIYGGVKEAIDNIEVPETGYSDWYELEMFDRLEARRAIMSVRHYLFQAGDIYRVNVRYDGNVVLAQKYLVNEQNQNQIPEDN